MKLISYKVNGSLPAVGIVDGERVLPIAVESVPGLSAMRRLLIENGSHITPSLADARAAPIPLRDVQVLPIVPDPGKVIAAPVNYLDHKAEMLEDYHIDSLGVFLKAPTSVLADGGTVRLPYTDRRFDQEGEVAIVIGKTASHVSAADAVDHIGGYTMLLDMTMRGGEDRSTRKSFDTFTPVGPWLVTPDEAGDAADMRLQTWVGGELRQDADVSDLIWGIPELVEYASSVMVLHPGDILTTGTPAGIGQVEHGDTIELEISNLGRLHVSVSSAGAVRCPTKGAARGPKPPATVTPVRPR